MRGSMNISWISFTRNTRSTLVVVALVAALAAFISVFTNSIRLSEAELENAYDSILVDAYIMGASATQLPQIKQATYDEIHSSGFIASSHAASKCAINAKDTLVALDSVEADSVLAESVGTIEWMEGYNEGVFASKEYVCVAHRASMLSIGDTMEAAFRYKRNAAFKLTVVGLYGSATAVNDGETYYCPMYTMRELLAEHNVTSFYYYSLNMKLCNTRELSVFKERMLELGLDGGMNRLVVNDALLIGVTTQLTRHIRLLKTLLPLIFALIAAMGFVLSFLLLRSRKREAAVMRCVGCGRAHVFFTLLMETVMQSMAGVLLGVVLALIITGLKGLNIAYTALVFVCFIAGGAFAVLRVTKVNVLELMNKEE